MSEEFKNITDEILFSRFKRGDQIAFRELMERYKGPLYSLIYQSTKQSTLTEELFQDTFYKVVHKRDYFDPNTSFKAWVYKICRNTCIDAARKRNKSPKHESLFEVDVENIKTKEEPKNPLEMTSTVEMLGFLDEAVDHLPPDQKETFYYKVRGEMTFDEVAETMGCSINTVKSRMRYALEKIRDYFNKQGYLE